LQCQALLASHAYKWSIHPPGYNDPWIAAAERYQRTDRNGDIYTLSGIDLWCMCSFFHSLAKPLEALAPPNSPWPENTLLDVGATSSDLLNIALYTNNDPFPPGYFFALFTRPLPSQVSLARPRHYHSQTSDGDMSHNISEITSINTQLNIPVSAGVYTFDSRIGISYYYITPDFIPSPICFVRNCQISEA
jgi:hypothetical protein